MLLLAASADAGDAAAAPACCCCCCCWCSCCALWSCCWNCVSPPEKEALRRHGLAPPVPASSVSSSTPYGSAATTTRGGLRRGDGGRGEGEGEREGDRLRSCLVPSDKARRKGECEDEAGRAGGGGTGARAL